MRAQPFVRVPMAYDHACRYGRAIVVFDVVYRLPPEIHGPRRADELVRGRLTSR